MTTAAAPAKAKQTDTAASAPAKTAKTEAAPAKAATPSVPPILSVVPSAEAVIAPIAAAQADAAKVIGEAVTVGKEAIETVVKASTDAAAKSYDQALDLGRGHVAAVVKAHGTAYQGYEDVVAFGRDTLEAYIQAGSILVKGLHEINRAVITLTQQTIEHNVAASKALLGARTLQEVIDVQAGLTRTGLDRAVSEAARLSDDSVKLVEQSLAPIGERVNAAIDRIVKAA